MFYELTGNDTFFHPNKFDKAEIDHILLNTQSKLAVRKISVDTRTSLNTSDHVLLVVGTFDIQIKGKVRQNIKKGKRKIQGVPQSQTAALPRPQEEEETDKSKQAQTEQTYEKH